MAQKLDCHLDGTSNFASVFGFVESGVALQDIFDNVNATSTANMGVQDVVKGSNEVYLDQTLTDDHALWVNGRSFVMSTKFQQRLYINRWFD